MESITTLIVDDERPFGNIVSQRLRQRGITASAVSSGPEALLRLAQTHRIEVVVLDLKMPGIDGIDTLRSIKKTTPLVEVVMLTGHATIDSAIEAMKSGAFDYLTKPFDIDQLVEKITAAARKKRDRDAKIREIRARPYISEREREEMIKRLLETEVKLDT
ncbi:MAG: response regulator [Desulfobacterales bacterium]